MAHRDRLWGPRRPARTRSIRNAQGAHQLSMPPTMITSLKKHGVFPLGAGAIALLLSCLAFGDAIAKAPPMATTVFDVEARAEPAPDAEVVTLIPADTEVELTGDAAPGYLAVKDDS